MRILDDLFQKDKKSKFEETMDSLMDRDPERQNHEKGSRCAE